MKKFIIFFIIFIAIFNFFSYNLCYSIEKLNVYTNSYIAFERNTKNVLIGNNINKRVPMASTTKIMTAILTIEYGIMDEKAIATINAQRTNGQQLNLKQGDEISINDLLYGIMLYSANDGAVVLAEHIGGSIENFCNMMNDKAKKIGAFNTNFVSPHGLDDNNHYSTPYDLAIIMDYALNMDVFRKVISTSNYTININNKGKNINNTNKLLNSMENVIGGKTGYTNMAGYCLVCNIKNKQLDVISVVLKDNTSKERFEDTENILKYCLDYYEILDINKYIKQIINIDVAKTFDRNIDLTPKKTNPICILKDNIEKIDVKYSILNNLKAPIKTDDVICVADIYVDKNKVLSIPYMLDKQVKKNNAKDYLKYIINHIGNILKIK